MNSTTETKIKEGITKLFFLSNEFQSLTSFRTKDEMLEQGITLEDIEALDMTANMIERLAHEISWEIFDKDK